MYRTTRAPAVLKGRLLASTIWMFAAALGAPALAGPTAVATAVPVDLPAGSLDGALAALAGQTHQQVLYTADLVAGRKAPAVRGAYTPEEALRLLLDGTGIVVKRTGPNVLVLQAAGSLRRPVATSGADRPFVPEGEPDALAETGAGAPPAETRPAPTTLAELTVTGSNIRGAAPASPLVTLDRESLERTGYATVAEALRTLPQNFGGGAAEGNSLTGADTVGRNTSFGTGVNLRGLGNGATLVLVNGRRVAGSGTFGDYADISSIPSAAVARVEVLLDGASAIYGSDAVGGVVNIITRKDFQGVEVRTLAGIGTSGGPSQGQVSITAGKRWSGGGLVLSYELQGHDRLAAKDRDFAASADLRPFGGSDFRLTNAFPGNILLPAPGSSTLVPSFAIPAGQNGVGLRPSDFQAGIVNHGDQRQGQDLLPRQTTNAIYAAVDQALGERLTLTADARFSTRRFKAELSPAISTFTVGRNNPFFVAPTSAASDQIAYSFAGQIPNPVSAGNVETLALTGGAQLDLPGGWRSEAYAAFAQEITELHGGNFVNSLILGEALGNTADRPDTPFNAARDGFFNPFTGVVGANSPGVLAAIGSGATYARIHSQVTTLNIQADGTVWRLPGGDLKLALGAQARREGLVRSGYNLLSTAAPAPTNPTDVSRDVTAAFAEARVPIFGEGNARPGLKQLELSLAGRLEHYQQIGSTFRPKFGVVWSPVSDLKVRATYSESFRAPALRELYDPALFNPTFQPLGANRILVLQLAGGNPNLKPETAKSWTAGVDLRPSALPGLTLSVTGFDIRFDNRIDRPVTASIANALVDPRLANFVQRISPATNPQDLALITALLKDPALSSTNGVFLPTEYGAIVNSRYVNTASLHVRGVEGAASYDLDLGSDRLRLSANATYLMDYEQTLTPTAPVIQRINTSNFPLRFQSRLSADWTRDRLTLGGAVTYRGGYHDAAGVHIGDFASLDLQARLAPAEHGPLAGVAILLTVRNAFDRDPPFYNNASGFAYDPANADPIGRFVALQLTRSW